MTEQQTRSELPDASLRSVGELLGDISSDLSTLLRQEVQLAKAEVKQSADHAKVAGGLLAGAGVSAHLALLFLSLAAWWALGDLLESLGWSALIVGVVWALLAALLAARGRARLRRATPAVPRTLDTAADIPDELKGHRTSRPRPTPTPTPSVGTSTAPVSASARTSTSSPRASARPAWPSGRPSGHPPGRAGSRRP